MIYNTLTASLNWKIDWQSSDNYIKSGGYDYASKSLIPRIEKMNGFIRQKIKEINEMIDTNLNILIGLSALIHGTLIISLHGCYLRYCNKIDTAPEFLT